jgi:hypothetical protein
MLQIEDDQIQQQREIRDHRAVVERRWRQFERPPLHDPAQRDKVAKLATRAERGGPDVTRETLVALLALLAAVSPIPLAVELFICGACGIHQVYQAYRLVHGTGSEQDARAILDDVVARVDRLPHGQARALMERLARKCEAGGECDTHSPTRSGAH